MMTEITTILSGVLLDDETYFNLRETCQICGTPAEVIIEMVDEGIVLPHGTDPREWRFSGTMIKRLQTTLRLQQDLGVNLPGAALVLELLEELEELRRLRRRIG